MDFRERGNPLAQDMQDIVLRPVRTRCLLDQRHHIGERILHAMLQLAHHMFGKKFVPLRFGGIGDEHGDAGHFVSFGHRIPIDVENPRLRAMFVDETHDTVA